ncbi:MAG: hypothetical protein GX638_05180, partial [Crenarchaeota archaeon]|nr:hypothetical protein [Thermoproteota archaeon]
MVSDEEVENNPDWRKLLRTHWLITTIFAVVGILLFAGAVYVFLWYVNEAQTTGLVPSNLGLWSMNNMVMFILHAVFWELLFIGIPAAIVAIGGWQWWKRLPQEEKNQYHRAEKRSKPKGVGGA